MHPSLQDTKASTVVRSSTLANSFENGLSEWSFQHTKVKSSVLAPGSHRAPGLHSVERSKLSLLRPRSLAQWQSGGTVRHSKRTKFNRKRLCSSEQRFGGLALRPAAYVTEDLTNEAAHRMFRMSDSEEAATFLTNHEINVGLLLTTGEERTAYLHNYAVPKLQDVDWRNGIAFIICHQQHYVAVVVRRNDPEDPDSLQCNVLDSFYGDRPGFHGGVYEMLYGELMALIGKSCR